ncbi:LysM peptidoglycan-binding domain-containing protein [Agreia pratensis]|uniref:LysM peptidoglycan-binding domain-containing protein n=1 Tax=Agreia pratensis TaxID=150121 RepID=UPI00188BEA43|nr:LysM peptidoglycan-binding domain-containing protein [Agreia pratensis]MBF4633802.1 LysM peptidoglycan-binding domain-containing protein [Agreia pratensis]
MTALPATASHSVRLRITRRGRVVLASLASIPVVACVTAMALFGANSAVADGTASSSASQTFDYVTVQAGETLWGLAEEIAPSADPRDVIADIVSLNQLPSAEVQPGQRLAVPNEY